jgi:hypothetical protein
MILKDGHTDVASSRRMCMTIIEDAQDIITALPRDMEASLPTWWTNKLATTAAYINGARDYLVYMANPPVSEVVTVPETNPTMVQEDQVMLVPDNQVSVGEFTSKHFDICPSAVALYKDIEPSALAVESAMLHDLLFKVEKQAITANLATPDMVNKTQHYADMINELAEEMNLVDEHSYVEDIHMAKMKELAENFDNNDEGEDDDMLPPSVRMMNAS